MLEKREEREEKRERVMGRIDKIESFRDLKVYQRAYACSLDIHRMSLTFPKHEQMELAGQIRRASKSVAMNIAEGFGKNSSLAEFKRFVMIALGSCDEVRVQIDYSRDLGYISQEEHGRYEEEYVVVKRMLISMLKNWRKI